eukprot:862360-Rhodomonas_salina.4
MRRRFILESVTLDMTLVTSYMPGLLAILQSVLPVILLGTTHFGVNYTVIWIILALCALHYSSITLTHVFIVDRVLVATETLAGVLISAALDNKIAPTIARRDTSKKTDSFPVSKTTLSGNQQWSPFITAPNCRSVPPTFKLPHQADVCTYSNADLIETGKLPHSTEDMASEFEQVHFDTSNNYKTAAQLQEEFQRALAQTQTLSFGKGRRVNKGFFVYALQESFSGAPMLRLLLTVDGITIKELSSNSENSQLQDALALLRAATNIALDSVQLNNEGLIWLPGGFSEMTTAANHQDETEHTVLLHSVFAVLQKQEDEIQHLVDAFNVRVKHANDIFLELSSQLESA